MKAKRFLATVLSICLAVLTLFSFAGCDFNKNQTYYNEMYLEDAYNSGCLTQEHLKSIAYYYNGETAEPVFELIPKVKLDKKTEEKIKLSYLQRPRIRETHPNAKVKDIKTFQYYGTYNGYAVVFIVDSLFQYDFIFHKERTIGGVTFYNYCELSVYKIGV